MKRIKKLFCLVLTFILLVPTLFVFPEETDAKTIATIRQEIDKLEKNLQSNKNQQKLTEQQIQTITNNISLIENEIEESKKEVEKLKNQSIQLEEDIRVKQTEIEKILSFYQLSSGESSYLEYTFGAATFTDFIYRVAVTGQLTKYNKKLVKQFNEMIAANNAKTEEIKVKQKQLDEKIIQLGNEASKLRAQGLNLAKDEGTLEEGIKASREELNNLIKLGCYETEEVTTCYRRLNSLPADTKFWRPLKSGRITSEVGGRWGGYHNGIDIADGQYGSPVYAAAAGIVVSTYNFGGTGLTVHIKHSVNGQRYTTAYQHLSAYAVQVNQVVDKDTVIGYVGNTGVSYGAHLHFTLLKGWNGTDWTYWDNYYWYNPTNPRDYINFPAGSGWFNDRITRY